MTNLTLNFIPILNLSDVVDDVSNNLNTTTPNITTQEIYDLYISSIKSLDDSLKNEIISYSDYNFYMNQINQLHNYSSVQNLPYFLNILYNVGTMDLIKTINFISKINNFTHKLKTDELDYLNKFFKCYKIELYTKCSELNNEIIFDIRKKKSKDKISIKNDLDNYILFNKINIINKITSSNIILNVSGAKIYLVCYKNNSITNLIIFTGYFKNDLFGIYKSINLFNNKIDNIIKLFETIEIPDFYKNNFINYVNISTLLNKNVVDIGKYMIDLFNKNKVWTDKNLTEIVRDFSKLDCIEKYNLFFGLLLNYNSNNNISINIINLLLDILNTTDKDRLANIFVNLFPWDLIKNLNFNHPTTFLIDKNTDDYVNYEKKIQFMNCPDNIKNKAMEKYKEIQSNKNGEGSSKAQQYLDGILKIPFGIYKNNFLKSKINDLQIKLNSTIDKLTGIIQSFEIDKLSNFDKNFLDEFMIIIKEFNTNKFNIINIDKFQKRIKLSFDKFNNSQFIINNYLSIPLQDHILKLKPKDIKDICKKLVIDYNKNTYLNDICNYNFKYNDYEFIKNYLQVKYLTIKDYDNYPVFVSLIEQIINSWNKYNDIQTKYFNDTFKRLDDSIYGLNDAKKQIKRLIAQWINGTNQGCVLGLEGPPGTGKTTISKDGIAQCLRDENGDAKPVIFIPLGGSSNGSTLEGHNYTYVGSTWGKIVDGLIEAKCMNPIIYIDELDKISKTEHGKELIGILTHMTDPAQNSEFTDKYFSGIKFDLSKAFIIFSYNDVDLIDKILLDRIQRIQIPSLSNIDKLMVAKSHIIPDILNNVGFTKSDIIFNDNDLLYLIENYTMEAGARKLKEKLYEIYRDINLNYFMGVYKDLPITITRDIIDKILDITNKIDYYIIHDTPKIGLMNGLFATSSGLGGITKIEAFTFPSSNHLELKLTGLQGDVMKESMNVAKTVALNLLPNDICKKVINSDDKYGIHIHCPEGATPKDGPSAGTAITIAIISLLCKIPIKNTVAITGEIDLNGNVLPIGGLQSKLDGAKKAGVLQAFYPNKNSINIEKIRKSGLSPESDTFKIYAVSTIYDALDYCLDYDLKANEYFNNI